METVNDVDREQSKELTHSANKSTSNFVSFWMLIGNSYCLNNLIKIFVKEKKNPSNNFNLISIKPLS